MIMIYNNYPNTTAKIFISSCTTSLCRDTGNSYIMIMLRLARAVRIGEVSITEGNSYIMIMLRLAQT